MTASKNHIELIAADTIKMMWENLVKREKLFKLMMLKHVAKVTIKLKEIDVFAFSFFHCFWLTFF